MPAVSKWRVEEHDIVCGLAAATTKKAVRVLPVDCNGRGVEKPGVVSQDRDGRWRTPPTDCGLLAGTMRAELLASGELYEGVVTLDELREAVHAGRQLVGFNAVRGAYRLRLGESGGGGGAGTWAARSRL